MVLKCWVVTNVRIVRRVNIVMVERICHVHVDLLLYPFHYRAFLWEEKLKESRKRKRSSLVTSLAILPHDLVNIWTWNLIKRYTRSAVKKIANKWNWLFSRVTSNEVFIYVGSLLEFWFKKQLANNLTKFGQVLPPHIDSENPSA